MPDLTACADTGIDPQSMLENDPSASAAMDSYDAEASKSNQKQQGFDMGDVEKVAQVAMLL